MWPVGPFARWLEALVLWHGSPEIVGGLLELGPSYVRQVLARTYATVHIGVVDRALIAYGENYGGDARLTVRATLDDLCPIERPALAGDGAR